MLTRFHKILIGLLAVQIMLVIIVLTRGEQGPATPRPVLAGFDAANATRLQVFSNGKPTLDLVKRDANWVVASSFGYPVDATKITDALTPLAKMTATDPIATQAARHKQLKVADNDFERKLVITMGGKAVTLFVGAPSGSRRNAVRIGGEQRVFGVSDVSPYLFSAEPRQWVNSKYVDIPKEEITKIVIEREGSVVELVRPAEAPQPAGSGQPVPPPQPAWTVTIAGVPVTPVAGESLNKEAIEKLVTSVATIDLVTPGDPKRDASKPTATITIDRKATGAATPAPMVLELIASDSNYWVHERGREQAAMVEAIRIDETVKVDRTKLITKPPAPPAAPDPAAKSGAPAGGGAGSAAKPKRPGAG